MADNDARSAVDITVESTISSVTVYENRAQVFRTASLTLAVGTARLVYAALPKNLDRGSLQVSLRHAKESATGAVPSLLKGITFEEITKRNTEHDTRDAEVRAAIARKNEIDEELRTIQDELERVALGAETTEACFKKAVGISDKKETDQTVDFNVWKAIVDTTLAAKANNATRVRELTRRKERLTKESAALPASCNVPMLITTKGVIVALDTRAECDVLVQLSYMVPKASWTPSYDIRVNVGSGTMGVAYHAEIEQTTEEDWKDVRLEVSTAKPAVSGKQPELVPWRISAHDAPAAKSAKSASLFRRSEATGAALLTDVEEIREDCDEAAAAPVGIATAQVNTKAFTSASFAIPQTQTITSGGPRVRVGLAQLAFTATTTFVTVPKKLQFAFARAEAVNTSEFPLLAGGVSVFSDQQFVAHATIARTNPREKLSVDLGVDEGISVNHKLLSKVASDKGGVLSLSSKRSVMTYSYEIGITNNKSADVKVEIQDQIPVSQNGDIHVTQEEPVYEKDTDELKRGDDGVLRIICALKKGEAKKIPLTFRVTYPEGRDMRGL